MTIFENPSPMPYAGNDAADPQGQSQGVLNPEAPYVWPEPRVHLGMAAYEHRPPFSSLALGSRSVFGIASAVTSRGIEALKEWLDRDPDFKASLIVSVYPACATRGRDLSNLLGAVENSSGRLSVHIRPLERITERATNTLCFLSKLSDVVHVVTGPSEDFGLGGWHGAETNLVFRADPSLVEGFKRYFDWLWTNSREITARGATQIPALVLPEGSEEGARLWREYMSESDDEGRGEEKVPQLVAHVDLVTGDVTVKTEEGQAVTTPTEDLGVAKLDPLAEQVARLYNKGALVSIDKLSRIPPLDSPLDPRLFGDASEIHRGNVTRRVSMRVSIIDDKTRKEIEKRRQGLRTLLSKFTFGLADNMRWMPSAARALFEAELTRLNEEGLKFIADLLKGDVGAFIKGRREALKADINAMYAELGRPDQVTEDVVARVEEGLKERLGKAQSASFMPKLSYSLISFASTDNTLASPWGQAYSLLADIATFPRKALTDAFFFRGLKVSEDDLIEAMNVANDALFRELRSRGVKNRCKSELELLARIERASMESRDRCELVMRILAGEPFETVDEAVKKKEAL